MDSTQDQLREGLLSMGYLQRLDISPETIRERYMTGLASMDFSTVLAAFVRRARTQIDDSSNSPYDVAFFDDRGQQDPYVRVFCSDRLPSSRDGVVHAKVGQGKMASWKPIDHLNSRSKDAVFFELSIQDTEFWPVAVGFFLSSDPQAGLPAFKDYDSSEEDEGAYKERRVVRPPPQRRSSSRQEGSMGSRPSTPSRFGAGRGYVTSDSDTDY